MREVKSGAETAGNLRVAITGGIGAGKSIVSRMLLAMRYPVYDCDSRAKRLMDSNPSIIRAIAEGIGNDCLCPDGSLHRGRLSARVFADAEALSCLNNIVHKAVREDLERWFTLQQAHILFVETAIPYSSGLYKMVDGIWEVTAPESVRIERVKQRSGLTADDIKARISSQTRTEIAPTVDAGIKTDIIVNDGLLPVLPQIESLLTLYDQSR